MTTDVPVTQGSGILCYVGEFPNYEAQPCSINQTTCSYIRTNGEKEYVNCYDPTKNDGRFYTNACFENMDIDDGRGHLLHGTICVCDEDDLCNEDYFKSNGARSVKTYFLVLVTNVLLSTLLVYRRVSE